MSAVCVRACLREQSRGRERGGVGPVVERGRAFATDPTMKSIKAEKMSHSQSSRTKTTEYGTQKAVYVKSIVIIMYCHTMKNVQKGESTVRIGRRRPIQRRDLSD